MGLDGVELAFEMEETFGIVIDDLDAEHIGTVGQAYRYILGKLAMRQTSPCPSAALFYQLRRALMARSGADRQCIGPAARIEDFLPERDRREAWLGLRDEIGMTMPRLRLAPWQARLVIGAGLASGAAILAAGAAVEGITSANLAPAVIMTSLFAALGWMEAYRSLTPFASTIPRNCETLRGTVETILGQHRLSREGGARTWHRDEVWVTLRELISEQLGVALDDVTEEKSFVNDFGMD
jgi:acyl carrier protein